MNELLKTNQFLISQMRRDPLLALAQTVAFFDPLGVLEEDPILPGDEDGTLEITLGIMRSTFPDIYFEALSALRQGADYMRINHLICDRMEERGLPVESIEFLGFGIPLPAYGTELEATEFYAAHPGVLPVAKLFGVEPGEGYYVEVSGAAYTAGQMLYLNLREHTKPEYRKVGYLLGWLFNATGNSVADLDYETMGSFQPLGWSPEEFEFAVEILEEADTIMADVVAGLEIVQSNPRLMRALEDNIKRIYQAIEKGKINDHTDLRQVKLRLEWPDIGAGTTGTAIAGA